MFVVVHQFLDAPSLVADRLAVKCGGKNYSSPYKLVLWKLYDVEGTYTPMYMTKDTVNGRSLGLRPATYVVIQHLSFLFPMKNIQKHE